MSDKMTAGDWLYYFRRHPFQFVQLLLAEIRPQDFYKLQWFHRDWIELPFARTAVGILPRVQYPEVEITAPRGFLKSTLLVLTHFVWWPLIGATSLERGVQPTGIMVCDSPAKMTEFANLVVKALHTPFLQGLLGFNFDARSKLKQDQGDYKIFLPPCELPWQAKIETQIEAAVRIKPVGSTQTGMHMTGGTLMFDDAAVSQQAQSPKRTAPRRAAIDDYKALADPAMIVHSDTRYTTEDYGIEVLEANPAVAHNWPPWTERSSRSAYADPEMTEAIWPDVRGVDWLEDKRKSMTESNFRAQYCNDLAALSGVIFPASLVDRCIAGLSAEALGRMRREARRVYGIDMSYGGQDFTAVACAHLWGDKIYLEDVLYRRYTTDEAAVKFRDVVNSTKHWPSYVEANGPQKANLHLLRQQGHPAIEGYYPQGDKIQRAEPLLASMQSDEVRIINTGQLAERLKAFTGLAGDRDDLVDAAVIAWSKMHQPNHGRLEVAGARWSDEPNKQAFAYYYKQ